MGDIGTRPEAFSLGAALVTLVRKLTEDGLLIEDLSSGRKTRVSLFQRPETTDAEIINFPERETNVRNW